MKHKKCQIPGDAEEERSELRTDFGVKQDGGSSRVEVLETADIVDLGVDNDPLRTMNASQFVSPL